MAQFYTLEEAARVLGMSSDELKAKAQHREIRAFMDSGSWRFRVADIDELARRRGLGSDPDLSLSEMEAGETSETGSEEQLLAEYQASAAAQPEPGSPESEDSQEPASGDVLLDDVSVPPGPESGSSSTIIGMEQPSGKQPSDSDVRLVPNTVKQASDSDVKVSATPPSPRPTDSDVTVASDDVTIPGSSEELIAAGSSEETTIRPSPTFDEPGSSSSGDSDSDFELTPSSVIDALQPESGSDFELTPLDASDEFEATPAAGPSDSDVTAAEPSASGINLGRPSDSGINLQEVGTLEGGQADSIELAPVDEKGTAQPQPAAAAGPPPGEKDIFEDTDFEVDALPGDSDEDRTVQLEAASDFELEDSDSASEVFAIDEEDVDEKAATAMAPAVLDEEADAFGAAVESAEVSDEISSAWDVEEEEEPAAAAAPATAARATPAGGAVLAAGATAEWGGLWVGLLGLATFFMLILTFVSMDLVRNMYEWRGGTPVVSGLINQIAGLFFGG